MENDELFFNETEKDDRFDDVLEEYQNDHNVLIESQRDLISFVYRSITLFLSSLATLRFWIRILLIIFVISTSLTLAIITYWSFYWYYIPKISHTLPVDFQFGNYPNHKDVLPYAKIVLLQNQFDQDPFDCLAVASNRLLSQNQYYDFTLKLTVPDSNIHNQLGMIMIETRFISCSNITIWTSRQPYLFPYKSFLHDLMIFFKRFVLLYFGWENEIVNIAIPLTRKHIIDQDHLLPISTIHITLSNPSLQFYTAILHIDARFTGLQYFMYYWFFTSSTVAIAFLFIFNIITWFILLLILWRRSRSRIKYNTSNIRSLMNKNQ